MNEGHFAKLRPLVKEMQQQQVAIFACNIQYHKKCILLIEQIAENEPKDKYDIARLVFINRTDENDTLETNVDNFSFKADTQKIREFFMIPFGKHLYPLFQALYKSIGQQLPAHYDPFANKKFEDVILKEIANRSSSPSDSLDRKYCNHIVRLGKKQNGEPKQRSDYNSQKTQICRSDLFKRFKKDGNLSFCYYEDPDMEKSDIEIIRQFAKDNGVR